VDRALVPRRRDYALGPRGRQGHDHQADEDQSGREDGPNAARPPRRPPGKAQTTAAGRPLTTPSLEREVDTDTRGNEEQQHKRLRPEERHGYLRRRRSSVAIRTMARTRSSSVERDIASTPARLNASATDHSRRWADSTHRRRNPLSPVS